jgi:large subunit ribosomal protein L3
MNSLLTKKVEQGQKFLENGLRIPVTKLNVNGNVVVAIKTPARDHYCAVQLGFDKKVKENPAKSTKSAYRFLREVRMADADPMPAIGDLIKASEVFKPGDVVNVTGISKGKGFAGGVKRHHFKGGPRTHGQSDRERAPGAIGSTTTPGRVYRGKRMAGKMGNEQVTVRNIRIVAVDDNFILVKGLVPGGSNTLLTLKKVGFDKKIKPLYVEKVKEEIKTAEAKVGEPKKEEKIIETPKVKVKAEVKEEKK